MTFLTHHFHRSALSHMLAGRFDILPALFAVVAIAALTVGYANFPNGFPAWSFRTPSAPPFVEIIMPTQGMQQIAVARDEVTVAQWNECVDDGACRKLRGGRNSETSRLPVTGINWLDTQAFIAWLNAKTRLNYRLPELVEWRAMDLGMPAREKSLRFADPRLAWAADYGMQKTYRKRAYIPGHFGRSAIGIRDLRGNVWEWTASCSIPGTSADSCPAFVVAGDHEANMPVFVTDPASGGCAAGLPPTNLGFRLVRNL
ncbi:MAG: SUMF1/EgtB/PvdO family nonheme iron enzyme [Nitratireductor sp.]